MDGRNRKFIGPTNESSEMKIPKQEVLEFSSTLIPKFERADMVHEKKIPKKEVLEFSSILIPKVERTDMVHEKKIPKKEDAECSTRVIPKIEEHDMFDEMNIPKQDLQVPDMKVNDNLDVWNNDAWWESILPKVMEIEEDFKLKTHYVGMTIHGSIDPKTPPKRNKRKIDRTRKLMGVCPLDALFWSTEDVWKASEFEKWMSKGRLRESTLSDYGIVYFKRQCSELKSDFNYNVHQVRDKSWFLPFSDNKFPFEQSHVDVVFYYLRKFVFYSNAPPPNRITTTDVHFDQLIHNMYFTYTVNPSTFTVDIFNPIIDYIVGFEIVCPKPWLEVDHVFFPIQIEDNVIGQWILGRLSFSDMTFYVYNSNRTYEIDQKISEVVKRYTVILPKVFKLLRYYAIRNNYRIGAQELNEFNEPLEVAFVERLPSQQTRDCGVHMVSYAEYFISDAEIPIDFDADVHRKRLGYLLYSHAVFKSNNGYESGDENPGSVPEHMRDVVL